MDLERRLTGLNDGNNSPVGEQDPAISITIEIDPGAVDTGDLINEIMKVLLGE